MDLKDVILEGARSIGVELRIDFDETVESTLRQTLVQVFSDSEARIILDVFGLAAVEWATLVRQAGRTAVVADDAAYLAAVRHMSQCWPPNLCGTRLLTHPEAADVVPLRGDYLKVFPDAEPEPEWAVLATPTGAGAALARMTESYRSAATIGLAGYTEWIDSRQLDLRVMTWMLRAQVLLDGQSQTTDPSGRVARARAAIRDFVEGVGTAAEPVPVPVF